MRRTSALAALVLTALLVTGGAAQPLPPDVTGGEFNCMREVADAVSLSVKKRIACALRCAKSFYRGDVPASDCVAPYGGKMLECLTRFKGPDSRLAMTIQQCGNGCPDCWENGDCSTNGEATVRPVELAAFVDQFIAAFMCEDASATKLEQQCLRKTMKEFPRMVEDVGECVDACALRARKGLTPYDQCFVTLGSEAQQCIALREPKHAERIDRACATIRTDPNFCFGGLPDGAGWSNLTTIGFGNYFTVDTYCSD
jgi:hypothetical protein